MALLTEEQSYDLCEQFNVTVVVKKSGLTNCWNVMSEYELWDDEGYTLLAVLPKDDFLTTSVLGRHLYGHAFDLGKAIGKAHLRRDINELLNPSI